MVATYEYVRSNTDKTLNLIHRAREWEGLPDHVRQLGSWQGIRRGRIDDLNAGIRRELITQGYAIRYFKVTAGFDPESNVTWLGSDRPIVKEW